MGCYACPHAVHDVYVLCWLGCNAGATAARRISKKVKWRVATVTSSMNLRVPDSADYGGKRQLCYLCAAAAICISIYLPFF
jgi:hypothetical protein